MSREIERVEAGVLDERTEDVYFFFVVLRALKATREERERAYVWCVEVCGFALW